MANIFLCTKKTKVENVQFGKTLNLDWNGGIGGGVVSWLGGAIVFILSLGQAEKILVF